MTALAPCWEAVLKQVLHGPVKHDACVELPVRLLSFCPVEPAGAAARMYTYQYRRSAQLQCACRWRSRTGPA